MVPPQCAEMIYESFETLFDMHIVQLFGPARTLSEEITRRTAHVAPLMVGIVVRKCGEKYHFHPISGRPMVAALAIAKNKWWRMLARISGVIFCGSRPARRRVIR